MKKIIGYQQDKINYYQDLIFRAFRTTDDPCSLQNIILRKQREQLRVLNYTKLLENYKEYMECLLAYEEMEENMYSIINQQARQQELEYANTQQNCHGSDDWDDYFFWMKYALFIFTPGSPIQKWIAKPGPA